MPKIISRLSFLLILSCCATRGGEDEAQVDADIYFSKEDKHWPSTEKILDDVVKRFPILRLNKRCIDDPENYKKLTQAEQNLRIKETGDMTLVFGPLYLTSRQERRDIEQYFAPLVDRVLNPDKGKGRVPADAAAYAKEIFGAKAILESSKEPRTAHIRYHRVLQDGKPIGWIADAYSHIHCPVCNDAQFLMALSAPDLKTIDLRPVRELERWGRPLDTKETAAFTHQFKGRTYETRDAKVDAITRSTKTTRAYENTVAEILKELKDKK